MSGDPWFYSWNYETFRVLFSLIPHSKAIDEFCEALLFNPLLSTWVFAFCFYRLWTKSDEQTVQRRSFLLVALSAFAIACLITLILRPWIHWAAPVLRPDFQPLFPRYLWGNGVANCFPSHSTLAYFTIAIGFWPLNRRLSVSLAGIALLLISFPRVYQGGHYPVDVIFSCVLGVSVLVAMWRLPLVAKISNTLAQEKWSGGGFADLLLFLWVLELGEGFRGLQLLAASALRAFSS